MADSFVTLVGNITRDPELRFTASGQAIASFGIAVNRRWQKNGEWQEQTSFFNVTRGRSSVRTSRQSLGKGARVIVTGRLEQREYETREGEKRTWSTSWPTRSARACGGQPRRSKRRAASLPTAVPRSGCRRGRQRRRQWQQS